MSDDANSRKLVAAGASGDARSGWIAAVLFAAAAMCVAPGALADDAPAQEKPTIVYGETHPDCLEWADGCIICRRTNSDEPNCSTPAPACAPTPAECRKNR